MRAAWGYIIAVRTKRNCKIRVSSIIKNIISQRIWLSVILLKPKNLFLVQRQKSRTKYLVYGILVNLRSIPENVWGGPRWFQLYRSQQPVVLLDKYYWTLFIFCVWSELTYRLLTKDFGWEVITAIIISTPDHTNEKNAHCNVKRKDLRSSNFMLRVVYWVIVSYCIVDGEI